MGRLRVPWTNQPQGASAPDRSTAFGANCDYLWTPQNDKVGVPKSRSYNGVVGTPNAAFTSGSSPALGARPWSTVLVMVFPSSGQSNLNYYDVGNSTGGARLLAGTGGSSIQLTWVASTVGVGANQLVETGIGAFDKIAGVLVTTWHAGGHTSWFKRPGKPIYTWSESLAIATPTDLRVIFNSSTIGIELAAISAVSLNATQAKSLLDNPWQICAPLQRNSRARTSSASGSTGTVAYTNANDTSAAAGTTTILGTLAKTNAADTSSASGTTTIVGSLATTNADDSCTASGTVGSSGVTGTLATTNANDTAAAAGTTTVTGTLARTNADDSVSAAGWVGVITGTLAYTNESDTSSATGTVTGGATQDGGGWMPPQGRRKTRKEVYAERVKLGILPPAIVRAAEKVAIVAETVAEFKADRPRYEEMFMRELSITKWSPDYTRAIQAQIEILEQEDEDILLLM